ncbi:MAG: right-handed parallel beta-helix repeat-containing protein, partial [Thermoplasmata archaeon]|nr:right-handed parallel beta-helix repeat-containing protein [Thermoplasmata archaeon]
MKKTSLFIIACVVVSLTFGALTFLPGNAGATTRYVGGGGPGNYTTIQGAINDANPGDNVFVYNGTYYENVVVDKPLSLIGESKDTTMVYNAGTGDVILVASDWVNVTGLTLRYAAWDGTQAAIRLWFSQDCYVGDNNVLDSNLGIALDHSSNNTIANNSVLDNSNHGIYLWHSDSNLLISNTASRNEHDGIRLYYANNNTVANNTVSNSSVGISLHFSPLNVITGNALSYNEYGIFLWYSTNITLASNAMTGAGIYLRGSWLEHWNTHTIGTSNTVNNKPVIFWKDVIGGTIPLGAGQVVLANTTHVVLENQDISNTSIGIQTGFSSNVTIANNTVASNSHEGIFLLSSSDNTIMNNTAYNNRHGIFLDGSNRNIITRNNASFSDRYGIYLISSTNNTVIDNNVSNNWDGIHLYWQSNDNIISNNTATENMDGISVNYCDRNTITNNLASANNWYGIDIASSEGDTIDNNTVSENFIG